MFQFTHFDMMASNRLQDFFLTKSLQIGEATFQFPPRDRSGALFTKHAGFQVHFLSPTTSSPPALKHAGYPCDRQRSCRLTSRHSHQLCNTEDSGFDEAVFQVDCGHRKRSINKTNSDHISIRIRADVESMPASISSAACAPVFS